MNQHKSSSHRQRADAAIGGLLAVALVVTGMLYLNFRNHSLDTSNSVAQNQIKTVAAVASSNNAPHLVYAAFSMPAPAAKNDTSTVLIKKGKQLYQAHTCSACHGPKAEGTAIAPPLAGIGHYFNEAKFSSLIHHPKPQMSAKGMPPAPLSDKQTHALWTYLNSMQAPAHRGPGVPAVVIFK
jgi:mono/diheme cytochrome c family protein